MKLGHTEACTKSSCLSPSPPHVKQARQQVHLTEQTWASNKLTQDSCSGAWHRHCFRNKIPRNKVFETNLWSIYSNQGDHLFPLKLGTGNRFPRQPARGLLTMSELSPQHYTAATSWSLSREWTWTSIVPSQDITPESTGGGGTQACHPVICFVQNEKR